MEISKIIDDIEIASPNDIENYLLNISKYILSKTEVINKLSSKKIENESQLKNYIIDNSENIITIFSLIKTLKEEFSISKRSFETMSNQMLILKKKYIEPFEKLKRSITNKTNIDNVITLYDNIKSFRNEVKIIHNHFLQDTLTLSDSNFELYIKLKRYPLSQFVGINYIKDDLEWFNRNDENILNKFRAKFEDAIINKDNNMILQFFEFFTRLDLLVTEIKNFSNKVLKELMVDNFLAKLIIGSINTTNDINDIDNITKIRNILSQFFINLENYSLVFENLGSLLKSSYDKKRFVLYENIMEIVSNI